MEDCIEQFCDNVYNFITAKDKIGKSLLVKKHTENLNTNGDFSFPNTAKSWYGHVACGDNEPSLMKSINKSNEDLVRESEKWKLRIEKVTEVKDRIQIHLHRQISVKIGLREALDNVRILSERLLQQYSGVTCDPLCDNSNDLTELRLKCVKQVVQNLCSVSKVQEDSVSLFVSSKSSSKCSEGSNMVLCGAVLNAKTGSKEINISADKYIGIRQNEMTLVAQHKYGVRVATQSKWKDFLAHLGESAVVFELLQVKPSSAIKINFDSPSSGSSKGASFILYNCARLETMIRTYREKENEGLYPVLPDFSEVDFSVLNHEDEWTLIFNYIMSLPCLLKSAIDIRGGICDVRPHHVCSFLSSMVRVFSQYYRRVRVLTEPRKHLVPAIHARLHMLIVLNDVLKLCLQILNIKSVKQM